MFVKKDNQEIKNFYTFFRIIWDVESLKGHDFFEIEIFGKISVFYCLFLLLHSIVICTV